LKTDNVAGSGLTWHGHGDVQHVTHQQWALLSRHTGVWAIKFDAAALPGAQSHAAVSLTTDQVHGIKFPEQVEAPAKAPATKALAQAPAKVEPKAVVAKAPAKAPATKAPAKA